MAAPIRLILVDDHAMFREGTAELLKRAQDMDVVAEAADGERAIELAQALKPDVVIMDVQMPVLSGLEATRRIHASNPDMHVLVLTAYDDNQYVVALLRAGASGYLLKTAPIADLIKAIHQVHNGDLPFDPGITRKLVMHVSQAPAAFDASANPGVAVEALTDRERAVLQLLARGLSNREIGEELTISHRTVQSHLAQLFEKMHVNSRLDAVLTGVRLGWLSLER